MSEVMVLKAEKRVAAGSAEARRIRLAGSIPAEVYGETGNRSIKVNAHAFTLMLKRHGEHQIMDMELDGTAACKVLLKEVQHDPLSGAIIHADFVEVSMNKPIHVKLPVHLTGEAVGTKGGAVLEQLVLELDVACLPGDMVEFIPVDVTALEAGHHLCVKDLTLPTGLRAITGADVVVASIIIPGAERSEAAAEAAAVVAPPVGGKAAPAKAAAPAGGKAAPAKAAAPAGGKAAPAGGKAAPAAKAAAPAKKK